MFRYAHWVFLGVLLFAFVAFAQDVPVAEQTDDVSAKTVAVIVLVVQFIASVLNMFASSNGTIGKVINALSLGFGKATPDPAKQ